MSGNDWVYGMHAVESLLKHNPDSILQLYILQGRTDERLAAVLARTAQRGIPVSELSRAELDEKSGGVHQGVVALLSNTHALTSAGILCRAWGGRQAEIGAGYRLRNASNPDSRRRP